MKNSSFLLVVALTLIFSLIGPSSTMAQPYPQRPDIVQHDCLKISRQTLVEYRNAMGRRMLLRSVVVNNTVQLRLYGFNKFNKLIYEKSLERVDSDNCYLYDGNVLKGNFTKNIDDQPLHLLIAAGPIAGLTNWYLKPTKYKSTSPENTDPKKNGYLSYILSNSYSIFGLKAPVSTAKVTVTRLNPSLPAR